MSASLYEKVRATLRDIYLLGGVGALLDWDQETMMPESAGEGRADMRSALAGILHAKITDDQLLADLESLAAEPGASPDQQVLARESLRDVRQSRALPEAFVREEMQALSLSQEAWKHARAASDFAAFRPHLEKVVALKRQEAAYLDPAAATPYDALLDQYEPGMTSAQLDQLFAELKKELTQMRAQLQQPEPKDRSASFPKAQQAEFCHELAGALGYDFAAGRLDASAHPFSSGIGPSDSRITIRYDESDIWVAVGALVHETGHALYEQGLPTEHFGTPLGESVSLGVHESQSRLWENQVGRSAAFWKVWYPKLKARFPSLTLSEEEFVASINRVSPSFIRVEADEMTYPLHVILRYELERALIEGSLEVADLPAAWNAKMMEYLGIEVTDDADGVLQDVHWSAGLFGYFPTYALGTLYAAQLFAAAKRELLGLEGKIASGDNSALLGWLREHVHAHGRRYAPAELIEQATGEAPSGRFFTDYLEEKYAAFLA